MLTYVLAVLLQLLFLHTFFHTNDPKTAAPLPPPANLDDIPFNLTQVYPQPETKLVLVVVDGLRYDFVAPDLTPFLSRAADCLVEIEVPPPTVTLPRIKTLTTGSVPQFGDVFANLLQAGASGEPTSDSFLHRAVEAGKRVVFYGDDTWTKLYPAGVFERSEPTSGWNVMDFYEADRNVTRNVADELGRHDWDVMVLHYSGLDHIGHVHGPRHPLVADKLAEMDQVIQKIAAERDALLLLVTGDHGMKDTGSHGGSTYPETHVPLAVVGGAACASLKAAQPDIVATLSVLLGLPIPAANVGAVIPGLLAGFDAHRLLYALRYSCLQLRRRQPEMDRASRLHRHFLSTGNASCAAEAGRLYETVLDEARAGAMGRIGKRSVARPLLTVLLQVACLFGLASPAGSFALLSILAVFLLQPFPYAYVAGLASVSIATRLRPTLSILAAHKTIATLAAVYLLSLCSTSFIEQEQQFWCHLGATALLAAAYRCRDRRLVALAIAFRLLEFRRLAAAGASVVPLALITFHCRQFSYLKLSIASLIYVFRACYADSVGLARLIWLLILFNPVSRRPYRLTRLTDSWMLICAVLLRPHNLPLLPLCVYASRAIVSRLHSPEHVAVAHVCLGKALFFLHGHSNSLASVDFAAGYVGLSEYSFGAVFAQVLCHTYAFPVLAALLALESRGAGKELGRVYGAKAGLQVATLAFCCAQMVAHGEHLFAWTVFAPKLVMESAHSAVLLVEVVAAYVVNYLCCKGVGVTK